MHTTTPTVTERADQPYLAIRASAAMPDLGQVMPPLHGEVFGWLERHGVASAGPPFFKFDVVDMERELEVEVGVPVGVVVAGDERVRPGVLPAGRYATMTCTGHYDDLVEATARLLQWGKQQGVTWDASADQRRWQARLEIYETDPQEEPDPDKWVTVLAFKLAD